MAEVGVLGCTGTVGQRFIQLLENHSWFEICSIGASERSCGKPYAEAVNWKLTTPIPQKIQYMPVFLCTQVENFLEAGCRVIFSALDASVAGEIESLFSNAGFAVFSNARNHRMTPNVPLVVPFVNPDHIEAVRSQECFSRGGFIVTNANCSTTGMVLALSPIFRAFPQQLKSVYVVTLQAISGAGYPGLPSLDILDNVVPYISGEEEKLEREYRKILGEWNESKFEDATFPLSAQVNRVPVLDGHTICLSLLFDDGVNADQVRECLVSSATQRPDIPSAPESIINVMEEIDRPQPRLDRDKGGGYTTSVGRIRDCTQIPGCVKLVVLSHNTIMGAAGSSIANAEIAFRQGLLG